MSTRARRAILSAVTIAYAAFALLVGFWATPVDGPIRGQLSGLLEFLHRHGAPAALDYASVEFLSNIVFFIPIGLLAAAELPRRAWPFAILIGAAFSGCIELCQLLFLPHRFASLGDVLSNTIGAAIGALVVFAVRSARDRRNRVRSVRLPQQ